MDGWETSTLDLVVVVVVLSLSPFCFFSFLLLLLLIRMKKKIRTTAATMKSIMNRWCIERVCELLGSEASRRHYLDIFLMYENHQSLSILRHIKHRKK